jgi:hypothetical protein
VYAVVFIGRLEPVHSTGSLGAALCRLRITSREQEGDDDEAELLLPTRSRKIRWGHDVPLTSGHPTGRSMMPLVRLRQTTTHPQRLINADLNS